MKRSDMLKKLARHLSRREVDDIYEDALDEMLFVQEAVLERLPNQPWFLQTETIFPLPLGTSFIQLPENYNGLMTRGGVWFAPVRFEVPAPACGASWADKTDQYGVESVLLGATEMELEPFRLFGLDATQFISTDNYFGNTDGSFEFIAENDEIIASTQELTPQGYHTLFVWSPTVNTGNFFTTPNTFAPGALTLYFKLIWPQFALPQEFTLEFSTWREANFLNPENGNELASVTLDVTEAEFNAEPEAVYQVTIPNPGAFNMIRFYTPQDGLGIKLLDLDLCTDGETATWDLSLEQEPAA